MIDCCIFVKEHFENVYKKYISIIGDTPAVEYDTEKIVCDGIRFLAFKEWCLIILLDEVAEEILIELSDGNRLIYLFSDDSQLDCEFVVIENNKIIRKKYIYYDLPELNKDEGFLLCEEKHKFEYWNDIDYMSNIAHKNPDKLFEH